MNLKWFTSPEQNRGLSGVKKKNDKKIGFTLAETLIALVVTGVVAAIMMPALNYLIQTKVREHQVEVSKQKFDKAVELMALNGKIGPFYNNTYEFVKELSKYLKINMICKVGSEPSNLPPISSCFGNEYGDITLNNLGDTYKLEDIKEAKDFGIKGVKANNETNDWTSDNIGILTVDGISMILSYNKKCSFVQPGVYTGNIASSCIAGMADIDGNKKPNAFHKDIYIFGSAKTLGKVCLGKNLGLCLAEPVSATEFPRSVMMTYTECMAKYNSDTMCGGDNLWCDRNDGSLSNYASLVEECGGEENMLTIEESMNILRYICDISPYASITCDFNNRQTMERLSEFGLTLDMTRNPSVVIIGGAYHDINYFDHRLYYNNSKGTWSLSESYPSKCYRGKKKNTILFNQNRYLICKQSAD